MSTQEEPMSKSRIARLRVQDSPGFAAGRKDVQERYGKLVAQAKNAAETISMAMKWPSTAERVRYVEAQLWGLRTALADLKEERGA